MLEVDVPGWKHLRIENLVLDLNGTLAVDGEVSTEVVERLEQLKEKLRLVVITAGTHGHLEELRGILGIEILKIEPGKEAEQKRDYVHKLGAEKTAAVGNGANDKLMLEEAALAVTVLEKEGLVSEIINSAHILVGDIRVALDLLLNPLRLVATLRR